MWAPSRPLYADPARGFQDAVQLAAMQGVDRPLVIEIFGTASV